MRAAGRQDYLPRALLARAALHRATGDFARAHADLQEVFEIAEPSGMRLHLADYHLEMARVLLAEAGFDYAQPADNGTTRCLSACAERSRSTAEGNLPQARTHIEAAVKLIEATGYHRRDPELAELQSRIRSLS
ncbi:MAG: hypothetical protein R3E95_24000 [Thiolinea sp.]